MASRGLFIVLEGIDGCGKTTVAQALSRRLRQAGKKTLITKEPTLSSAPGKKIAAILQHKLPAPPPTDFQKLYIADRLRHIEKTLRPALSKGVIVICQRYALSTYAYGTAFGVAEKDLMHDVLKPDATFFLDIKVSLALKRIAARNQEVEYFEKRTLLKKIDRAYKQLMRNKKQWPVTVLDASEAPGAIVTKIVDKLF